MYQALLVLPLCSDPYQVNFGVKEKKKSHKLDLEALIMIALCTATPTHCGWVARFIATGKVLV